MRNYCTQVTPAVPLTQVVGYYTFHQPVVMIFDADLAREVFSKNESTGRPHLEILKMRTFGELRGQTRD